MAVGAFHRRHHHTISRAADGVPPFCPSFIAAPAGGDGEAVDIPEYASRALAQEVHISVLLQTSVGSQ